MRITFDMASRSVQLRSDSVSNVQLFIYRTHCNNYKYVKFFWPSALHVFVFVCLFVCHAYTAWFDLLEQIGGKVLLLWEHEICFLDVQKRLLCAAFRIWKRWECSSLESSSSVAMAYCETCFERKWQNKWILKKHKTGTTWKRNCDVALGISNNKRQTKTKKKSFSLV